VKKAVGREWLLLVHVLPPKPTNLRVRTWRKLQKLGAVAIKSSVYVLPFDEKTAEDFDWLKQEIESLGGEASVFRAGSVEGATDDEIVAAFNRDRDEAYAHLTAELEAATGALEERKRGGHLSPARLARYEADVERLHVELERLAAIDFFSAANGAAARAAYERCSAALRGVHDKGDGAAAKARKGGALDLREYQGRRWVTRRNLHVDRLASAWLVKRFVDKRPRFHFVGEGEALEGAIRFDMAGGDFTHVGEDCTFETMVRRFGLGGDPGLRAIAEIVHDVDLKDAKFNRLEAAGFAAVVDGLVEAFPGDRERLDRCGAVFEGLYALFGKRPTTRGGKAHGDGARETGGGRPARRRPAKRR
jgi:hypothetical protein